MFEARPPKAPGACDSGPDYGETDGLRPLTWSDLRLRLAVVRDLRTTLHADLVDAHASFDSLSARGIADRADGKETVNPDDLANGKGPYGMTVANENSGTGGDPRK